MDARWAPASPLLATEWRNRGEQALFLFQGAVGAHRRARGDLRGGQRQAKSCSSRHCAPHCTLCEKGRARRLCLGPREGAQAQRQQQRRRAEAKQRLEWHREPRHSPRHVCSPRSHRASGACAAESPRPAPGALRPQPRALHLEIRLASTARLPRVASRVLHHGALAWRAIQLRGDRGPFAHRQDDVSGALLPRAKGRGVLSLKGSPAARLPRRWTGFSKPLCQCGLFRLTLFLCLLFFFVASSRVGSRGHFLEIQGALLIGDV